MKFWIWFSFEIIFNTIENDKKEKTSFHDVEPIFEYHSTEPLRSSANLLSSFVSIRLLTINLSTIGNLKK